MSEQEDTPSSVAMELLSKAKDARFWAVMWMDEEGTAHWRKGGSAYMLLGALEVLKKDLLDAMTTEDDESGE